MKRKIDIEINGRMRKEKDYQTSKVIVNPKDDDLIIPGEFLGIEVHFTSFSVKYQMVVIGINPPETYQVYSKIYPITQLRRFFKVNGTVETPYPVCDRPIMEKVEKTNS
jgi:hypothetical protein